MDQNRLKGILSGRDSYAEIVRELTEQFLHIKPASFKTPIPGDGEISCITKEGVQFLVDADVLVDKDKKERVEQEEND